MDISSYHRRTALKLIARVHRLGKQKHRAVSRAAVLTAVAVLVVVAWLAIAFDRVGLAGARDVAPLTQATTVSQQAPRTTTLAKREAMVYLVAGDETHYHASVHEPNTNRKAMCVSMAKSRGLAPCPACFRGK
jgi:hypothetical protein